MRPTTRRTSWFVCAVLACSCASSTTSPQATTDSGASTHDGGSDGGNPNSLSGTEDELINLAFISVTIVFQQDVLSIAYVADTGDTALLTVDLTGISAVAGATIDLTQMNASGEPRGS